MQTYEIIQVDGTKGKITEQQIMRVFRMMQKGTKTPMHKFFLMNQKNEEYLHKALRNIKMILQLQDYPETQDELKKLLYKNTNNLSWKQTEMLYEMIQAIIGMYFKKIDQKDQRDQD